ncbi:hypothetical protein [Microbulbifer sp. TYP-18]|uniref:hypothetical protein n=1 Tax=Microbulbifer sp. TYP-18 TaxID=3230024 RepID=UPI0034C6CF6C
MQYSTAPDPTAADPQPAPIDMAALIRLLDQNRRQALSDIVATPQGRGVIDKLLGLLNLSPGNRRLADSWLEILANAEEDEEPGYLIESPPDDEDLQRELADLRNVNDNLAAALGACADCWGADPDCEFCDGHGEAGCYQPDRRLFRELVAPAVKRVGANKARQLRLAHAGR